MMYKLLTLILLLTAVGAMAGDKKVAYFGLELGKKIPDELKAKVAGKILKEVPAPNADWTSYAVLVTPTLPRVPAQGDYVVDSITAFRTFPSEEAARAESAALRTALIELYGVAPGQRFKVDETMDAVCLLVVKGSELSFTIKKKRAS